MKKLMTSAALLCSVVFLTACGGKEQSVSYRSVTEESGITMTDTMTFDAKGDVIQTLTEVIEMDMSTLDDATFEQMEAFYDELAAMYESVDGAECTVEEADKVYTITVVVDTTGDAVDELAAQGLMEIEGDGSGLSLKASSEALEASGFEKVE